MLVSLIALLLPSATPAQPPSSAGTISSVTVDQDRLGATISFPGNLSFDLELRFEQALGLSLAGLGLSAEVIDPLDPNLLARLPGGEPISIPQAFPIQLTIEPPASSPLTFRGTYELEIYTHNLSFSGATSPLRLYSAPLEGGFADITTLIAPGSYRARGTDGGFSQFLIVTDLRSTDDAVAQKLESLRNDLDQNAAVLPAAIYDTLRSLLHDVEWAWYNGALPAATASIDAFLDIVREESGNAIPDIWRASRDLENIAGGLRGAASSVRFSLNQKANEGL